MKEEYSDYRQDMSIDDSSLDLEVLDQPELMLKYSELCAEAKFDMDEEKENLELLHAQLDIEIRKDPEAFDLKNVKITEAVILNTIKQEENWQLANKKYLKARYTYEVLKGAVTAVEHRKTSLELLVKLYGQQYFAGPSVPRDLAAERRRKQANADDVVALAMKKRTRTKK